MTKIQGTPSNSSASASHAGIPNRNLLLWLSASLCGGLGILCCVIWLIPAAELPDTERAAVEEQQVKLTRQIAEQKVDLADLDRTIARRVGQLDALNQFLVAPRSGAPPEEVAKLESDIAALKAQVPGSHGLPSRGSIPAPTPPPPPKPAIPDPNDLPANLPQATPSEINTEIDPETAALVLAKVARIYDTDSLYGSGTLVKGSCLTTTTFSGIARIESGLPNVNINLGGGCNAVACTWPFIKRYQMLKDGKQPSLPATAGFQAVDFEHTVHNGQAVFCFGNAMSEEGHFVNIRTKGYCRGTLLYQGRRLLRITIAPRATWAGGPIVTSEGKLIGLMMPPIPELVGLCLVMPIGIVERELDQP